MSKARRPAIPVSSAHSSEPRKKLSGQTLFLWAAVAASVLVLAALAIIFGYPEISRYFGGRLLAADSQIRLDKIPFNGTSAYDYLKQLCDFGPRRSGSEAMAAQQKFLAKHFEKLGAKVEFQRFTAPYPPDGPDEQMIGHDVPM